MFDLKFVGRGRPTPPADAVTPATLDADIDTDWYLMKLQDELGDMTRKYLAMTGRTGTRAVSKRQAKKAFVREMSDVFCLTLLLADRCKVKLRPPKHYAPAA